MRSPPAPRPMPHHLFALLWAMLAASTLAGSPSRAAAQYPLAPSPVLSLDGLSSQIDLSGYLSMRETVRDDSAAFGVNRARVTAQVLPLPWAAVRLQADFSAIGRTRGDTVPAVILTDAYVQFGPPPGARGAIAWVRPTLVVGQFKTPFSLEYLSSFAALPTANRSLAVDRIAPRRELGALATFSASGMATVWATVANGEGSNATGNPDARQMIVGRLSLFPAPFAAVSGKWANQGSDHRWGFDARVAIPRVIVEGEYLRRSAPVPAAATLDARGGYALAAVRALPWLQPVVKWERLRTRTTSAVSSTYVRDSAVTYGINFLAPRDRVRLQLDWVHRTAAPSGSADELIAQLQAIF